MSVVRLILWLVAAALFAVFAAANWTQVAMVFGTTEVGVRLPALLLAAVLAGFLPMWVAHRLARRRWTLRTLAASVPVSAAYVPPVEHPGAVAQAQPTIVPPGCG